MHTLKTVYLVTKLYFPGTCKSNWQLSQLICISQISNCGIGENWALLKNLWATSVLFELLCQNDLFRRVERSRRIFLYNLLQIRIEQFP